MKKLGIVILCYPFFLLIFLAIDSEKVKERYIHTPEYQQRVLEEEPFDLSGLITLEGEPADQSLITGKTTLVQFSFYGCGPCQRAKRRFPRLLRQADNDFQIITISTDSFDYWKSVNKDMERWKKLNIANSSLISDLKVTGFPTYYLLNTQGQIISKPHFGRVLGEIRGRLGIKPNRLDLIAEWILERQDYGGFSLLMVGYTVAYLMLAGLVLLLIFIIRKLRSGSVKVL